MTEYLGGCTRRSARYCLTDRPIIVHCCHCRWCQRETGASFALNALIEFDRMELLSGTVEVISTPSNSGKGQRILRCPTCYVALWSNYSGAGDTLRFVRIGTLDEPDLCPPPTYTSLLNPNSRGSCCPQARRHSRSTTIESCYGRRRASRGARLLLSGRGPEREGTNCKHASVATLRTGCDMTCRRRSMRVTTLPKDRATTLMQRATLQDCWIAGGDWGGPSFTFGTTRRTRAPRTVLARKAMSSNPRSRLCQVRR